MKIVGKSIRDRVALIKWRRERTVSAGNGEAPAKKAPQNLLCVPGGGGGAAQPGTSATTDFEEPEVELQLQQSLICTVPVTMSTTCECPRSCCIVFWQESLAKSGLELKLSGSSCGQQPAAAAPFSSFRRHHPAFGFQLFLSLCAADSGVSLAVQADDTIGQQNGNYQSLPEPISSAQMISSPPALADRLAHQTPASDESFLQAANQGPEVAYQQAASQLHPGAYQQSTVQLHQGPYQSQTVSQPQSIFFCTISCNYKLSILFLFCLALCLLTHTRAASQPASRGRRNLLLPEESCVTCCWRGSSSQVEVLR